MAPVLHMIYAGHGDTFILEYEVNTVKKLVIVDGGPRKRSGEVLRAGAYAPYPKYLVSAAKAIWQASRGADIPFAPDAIFNSHPDSDHYEGLLELLKSSLEDGNAAPNTDAMVFNGPFLVPVMFDRNGNKANQHALNALGKIRHLLRDKGFSLSFMRPHDPGVDGIDIIYPQRGWHNAQTQVVQQTIHVWKRTGVPGQQGQDEAEQADGPAAAAVDLEQGLNEELASSLDHAAAGTIHTIPDLHVHHARSTDIDVSVRNMSSILLQTNLATTNGRVLMTGDSIGWRINEQCFQPQGVPRPHVQIYKIQHHGSVRNSQLAQTFTPVHLHIVKEIAVRELMERGWGDVATQHFNTDSLLDEEFSYFEEELFDLQELNCALDQVRLTVFLHLVNISRKKPGADPEYFPTDQDVEGMCAMYLSRLRVRHHGYLRHYATTAKGGQHVLQLSALPDGMPTPVDFLRDLVHIALENAKTTINEFPVGHQHLIIDGHEVASLLFGRNPTNGEYAPWLWWAKWHLIDGDKIRNRWAALYEHLAAVGRVAAFYRSFTADIYVASANGTHGHPSATTILGIALVALQDKARRRLYLTSGHALPAGTINTLAYYLLNVTEMIATLGGNGHLSVHYINQGIYTSLSADPTHPMALDNRTIEWTIADAADNLKGLHGALDADKCVLPRRSMKSVKYRLRLVEDDNLYLNISGNHPRIVDRVNAPEYTILENWESGNDHYYDAVDVRLTFIPATQNQQQGYVYVVGDPESGYMIAYRDINNSDHQYVGYRTRLDPIHGFQGFADLYHEDNFRLGVLPDGWTVHKLPIRFERVVVHPQPNANLPPIQQQQQQPLHQVQPIALNQLLVYNQQQGTGHQHTDSSMEEEDEAGIEEEVEAELVTVPESISSASIRSENGAGGGKSKAFMTSDSNPIPIPKSNPLPSVAPVAPGTSQSKPIPTSPAAEASKSSAAHVGPSTAPHPTSGTTKPGVEKKPVVPFKPKPMDEKPNQPTKKSLEAYCKSMSISLGTTGHPPTINQVLEAIIGPKNVRKLGFSHAIEKKALDFAIVSGAASTVSTSAAGFYDEVHGAELLFTTSADAQLLIVGDATPFHHGKIEVEWPSGEPLVVVITLFQNDGVLSIKLTRRCDAVQGTPAVSLSKILTKLCQQASIKEPNLEKLALPKLLGLLTDRTPQEAALFLARRLPSILVKSKILMQHVDLIKSTAFLKPSACGNLLVRRANLVTDISKLVGAANKGLSIAELDIQFGDVELTLFDARTTRERITFSGSATIASSLTLKFEVTLSEHRTSKDLPDITWKFTARGNTTLSDLTGLWKNKTAQPSDYKNVPLSSSALNDMIHSQLGFVITQPVAHTAHYDLVSIFAGTKFSQWSCILPEGFPVKEGFDGTGRIEIRHPLTAELRALYVAVDFEIPIITAKDKEKTTKTFIKATLAAEPLATPKHYDYRLYISSPEVGVTILDLADAIHLGDQLRGVKSAIPLVGEVLEKVHLKSLEVVLAEKTINSKKKWTLGEFSIEMSISSELSLTEKLKIQNAEISLDYSAKFWDCKIRGSMEIDKRIVEIAVATPLSKVPGYIQINAPRGLSTVNIIRSLGLPAFENVPLLQGVLETQLSRTTLGLENDGKKAHIVSGIFDFTVPFLPLGFVNLADVETEIEWRTIVAEGKPKKIFAFSIQAHDDKMLFGISASYKSSRDKLTATFMAISPVPVVDTFKHLIQVDASAHPLLEFIGTLGVSEVSAELNTKNFRPETLKLVLTSSACVVVDNLTLQHLEVLYVSGHAAEGTKPETPSIVNVVGVVAKGESIARVRLACQWGKTTDTTVTIAVMPEKKGSLSLSGLLKVFDWTPALDLPPEFPKTPSNPGHDDQKAKLFSLDILKAKGTVSITHSVDNGKKSTHLKLQAIDVAVESKDTMELLKSPVITLENLSLKVHYVRTDAQSKPSIDVWAYLRFSKDIVLGLRYVVDKKTGGVGTQSHYEGLLKMVGQKDKNKIPDYKGVATSYFGGAESYAIPRDIKLPEALPLTVLRAEYRPGELFQVWGEYAGEGTDKGQQWTINTFGSLVITVDRLGGRFARRLKEPKSIEATIYGELSFDSFTSAKALLDISRNNKTKRKSGILIASLKRNASEPQVDELDTLTKNIAGDNSSLAKLRPAGTEPTILTEAGLVVIIDFTEHAFLLAGHINKVGSMLIMARKHGKDAGGTLEYQGSHAGKETEKPSADKYDYLLFIKIDSLQALWPALNTALEDSLALESITAQIASRAWEEGTVHAQKELLEHANEHEVLEKTKTLQHPSAQHSDKPVADTSHTSHTTTDGSNPTTGAAPKPDGETHTPTTATTSMVLSEAINHLPADAKIKGGAAFHATIRLDPSKEISGALWFSAQDGSSPKIQLSAEILNTGKTTYTIGITDFALLGGSVILRRADGSYSSEGKKIAVKGWLELRLEPEASSKPHKFYVEYITEPKQTKFLISKEAKNLTSPSAGGDKSLVVVKQELAVVSPEQGTVVAKQEPIIEDIFGGTFGMKLAVTEFTGTIDRPQDSSTTTGQGKTYQKGKAFYKVSGYVKIGSMQVFGEILFAGGVKPKLLLLRTVDAINITEVYSGIIHGGTPTTTPTTTPTSTTASTQAAWPHEEFGDIRLKNAEIYYMRAEGNEQSYKAENDKIYMRGFNIRAALNIFTADFNVSVHLPGNKSGVSITGSYGSPINLGFCQLTKRPAASQQKEFPSAIDGPEISIQSHTSTETGSRPGKEFTASAGVRLLGQGGFYLSLNYTPSMKLFTGKAVYEGTLQIAGADSVGHPSLEATYDRRTGKFKLQGFHIGKDMKNLIDIDRALRDASKKIDPRCPDLSDLVLKGISTSFSWSIDLEADDLTEVSVLISGKFTVKLKVPLLGQVAETELDMPFLTLTLKDFTLTSLVAHLAQKMIDSALDLGMAILNQKEKAAVIIGWIAAEDITVNLIRGLICRKIKPPNVRKFITTALPKEKDDPQSPESFWDKVKNFLEKAKKIIEIIVVVVVVIAAIAFFAEALVALLEYEVVAGEGLAVLRSLISRIKMNSIGGAWAEAEAEAEASQLVKYEEMEKRITDALSKARSGIDAMRRMIRNRLNLQGKPSAKFSKKNGAIRLDWDHALPRQEGKTGFEAQGEKSSIVQWEVVFSSTNEMPPDAVEPPNDPKYQVRQSHQTNYRTSEDAWKGYHEIHAWVRTKYQNDPKLKEVLASERWAPAEVVVVDDGQDQFSAAYTLSGKPSVCFKEDGTSHDESIVCVDWASVVPGNAQESEFRKYGQLKWEVVISPTNDVSDQSAARQVVVNASRVEVEDALFATATVLFVFVRAVIDTGIQDANLQAPWTDAETMSLTRRLAAPREVYLSVPVTIDGTSVCEVKLLGTREGDYAVELRALQQQNGEDKELLLFQETISVQAGSDGAKIEIPVSKFFLVPDGSQVIRAFARQVAEPGHHAEPSAYVKSVDSTSFAAGPSKMNAYQSYNDWIEAHWQQIGDPAAKDFTLTVTNLDGSSAKFNIEQHENGIPQDRRRVRICLSYDSGSGPLTVTARSLSSSPGLLARQAQLIVARGPHDRIVIPDPGHGLRGHHVSSEIWRSIDKKVMWRRVFGLPMGNSSRGKEFSWATSMDKKDGRPGVNAWPRTINWNEGRTTVQRKESVDRPHYQGGAYSSERIVREEVYRLFDLKVTFDDGGQIVEAPYRHSSGFRNWEKPIELQEGERIVQVNVYVHRKTDKPIGLGFVTSSGKVYDKAPFVGGGDVGKVEHLLPSGCVGLKGFWGEVGKEAPSLVDRIGPVWGTAYEELGDAPSDF